MVYVLFVHLFVYFARVDFDPFSLPLGVGGWMRLVIVAFPDSSINFLSDPLVENKNTHFERQTEKYPSWYLSIVSETNIPLFRFFADLDILTE